ncbi:MAG: hypothetical protein KGZ39_04365 [Simkania sp.]|nr:hypothetical protein [Simkania sp.]
MKSMIALFFLLVSVGFVSGCYQIHSDDDLRAVPTTNNPHVFQNGNQSSSLPKVGF